jgi:predicted TIM-barrel fold metal-dependent hydrolase
MLATVQTDLHQHVYTRPLLDRLERRRSLPFARRLDGITTIHAAGELAYAIETAAEAADIRARLKRRDGLDRAVVAISSPLGIEALPRPEALELIEAHLEGVDALPDDFAAWGPVALNEPDVSDVDAVLDWGCVGVSVPAGALVGRERLDLASPLLQRVAARGAPLFVHPGLAPGERPAASLSLETPWWGAKTSYVSQMQAAWLTFACAGRREHPDLVVVFAMLAGCAPLQAERLSARHGPSLDLSDPVTFYETSSYGRAAVDTMARLVGERQLVYGSDRPVVEPTFTGRESVLQSQAGELISGRVLVA